jgi:hypothetical protein
MARGTAGLRDVSEARLILTCGLPGAGKTALARQLAADRSAVRLTTDEWLAALGSSPWDTPAREKVEHELWRLAQEILRLGLASSSILGSGRGSNVTRCDPRLGALVSQSNCTSSTCLLTKLWAYRRPTLAVTVGQPPDPPRRPRWMANHFPGAPCCRARLVRLPARLKLSHYQSLGRRAQRLRAPGDRAVACASVRECSLALS